MVAGDTGTRGGPPWLFRALDELGAPYTPRADDAGAPGAFWEVAAPRDRRLELTAAVAEGVLRLTVHSETPGFSWERLLQATQRLTLVAAFVTDAEVVAGLRCHVGERGLSSAQLAPLIGMLTGSHDAVVAGPGVTGPGLPVLPGTAGIDLDAALDTLGRRRPDATVDGTQVGLDFHGGRCHLTVGATEGWLTVTGTSRALPAYPPHAEVLGALQAVQNEAAAGRYLVGPDGTLRAEVATPLLTGSQAEVDWSLDQAVRLLEGAGPRV